MVTEIFIQSKDKPLNGASPKPITDNKTKQEMNPVPCTIVNETDHLMDNGSCISLNSVSDNIKSTKNQLQSSSQTGDLDTPKGPPIHDKIIKPHDSDFSRSEIIIEAIENCAFQENNVYQKYIDSFQDEMDQDHIWCMLTDVLSYTRRKSSIMLLLQTNIYSTSVQHLLVPSTTFKYSMLISR